MFGESRIKDQADELSIHANEMQLTFKCDKNYILICIILFLNFK